jgi:hypothetical protein
MCCARTNRNIATQVYLQVFSMAASGYEAGIQAILQFVPQLAQESDVYSRQTMRWSLRGVNILSAVRGEYRACKWTEDFLLVSAKVT